MEKKTKKKLIKEITQMFRPILKRGKKTKRLTDANFVKTLKILGKSPTQL